MDEKPIYELPITRAELEKVLKALFMAANKKEVVGAIRFEAYNAIIQFNITDA